MLEKRSLDKQGKIVCPSDLKTQTENRIVKGLRNYTGGISDETMNLFPMLLPDIND